MGKYDLVIGLGLLGVGGYVAYKYVWPAVQNELDSLFEPSYSYQPEERIIPTRIGYDAPTYYPPVIYEDRYPDYYIEDRYPDYYVSPPPIYNPPPIYTPPICPPGRYWNGDRCKKIDIDCPSGYKEDNGVCVPRQCDRDEIWTGFRCQKIKPDCDRDEYYDGSRCRKIPRLPRCSSDEYFDGNRCKKIPKGNDRKKDFIRIPRELNNSRDRWHLDRDREEMIKKIPTEEGKGIVEAVQDILTPSPTPETDRQKDIATKAAQNFIEIWSDY